MLEISVLITACILNGLLGLVVYLKNPESATNKLFFALTGSFVAWSLVNYASLHPFLLPQLDWIRLVLFAASLLCLLVFLTFTAFPDVKLAARYHRRALLATYLTAVVMMLTLTPFIFKSLSYSHGQASPVPAPGIGLFLLQSVGLLGAGIFIIIRKHHSSRDRKVKEQLRLVLLGVAGTFLLIVSANLLLVVIFNVTALVSFGPAFTLVFSAAFAYAIIRHKLFDIKAAIARSVSYLLIVGTMTIVYGVALFGVIDILFQGSSNQNLRQILSVLLITPLVLSFQAIRRFFDRLTNRLFYRESYDTQEVLDEVGKIVTAEIELHRILNDTRKVLTASLKSSFIEFILFKNGKPYFEAHTHKIISQNILAIGADIAQQEKDLLVTDDFSNKGPLQNRLGEAGVSLSLRLKTREQLVGYIIFGAKKGGDAYNAQDRKLLLILSNELAVAVQNALRFEEIQNFNLTLQAKVDEATRKLRTANEKLREMDETKDDFISMASHQLRTPLTSVKGYISMVLEGDAGKVNEKQREMLGQAFFSSQRMVYLIADLLNVSRLKTGKFIIEPAPVDLAEIVKEELSQLEETAASRSLTLSYDKPKNFPQLMLDETKTRQVIMNFVDNAIYYTPSGGHIAVHLLDNKTTVELKVEDDGIGVPKSEQPHLFTKFYRAGNARKARPDGTGLGLFMAKKVVVAQGGSLIFDSQEGKGSTFGFTFSKSKLAAKQKT